MEVVKNQGSQKISLQKNQSPQKIKIAKHLSLSTYHSVQIATVFSATEKEKLKHINFSNFTPHMGGKTKHLDLL